MATRLEEMRQARLTKLRSLRENNIDPFTSLAVRTHTSKQAQAKDNVSVTVVGRIIAMRGHGKLQFIDLKDSTGKIQLVFQADQLSAPEFDRLSLLDTGDFLQAEGSTFTTKSGEHSVQVKAYTLLTKALRPLPTNWYGLKDREERYRQRYVDLQLNDQVKELFITRSKIITLMRAFLDRHGFLEVETPVLQPIYGGATAKPFITHHNALNTNFYLRIADELYLKRLLVGGFEKVYEIGHDFRNEGLSHAHSPEFTQLEFYWAYADYTKLMEFTEQLVNYLIGEIKGQLEFEYQGIMYNFSPPWERLTYHQALQKYAAIDIKEITDETMLYDKIRQQKIKLDLKGVVGYAALLDTLYKKTVRPQLSGPLFLTDYPYSMKPLAKRKIDNPDLTGNFQLLVAGEEYVNAYNELNDPQDQRARWEEETALAQKGLAEHQVIDEDYLRALEYGMPPTAGWGMGIDRLTMLLTDQHSIKDVILFPTLKPEFVTNKSTSVSNTNSSAKETQFKIDQDVTQQFPGMFYIYTLISNVKISKSTDDLEKLKDTIVQQNTPILDNIPTIKGVACYRELFKVTKVWGEGRRPSPEALLRRLAQGKGIYNINTAVDAYNLAVIETGIGLGGFDIDKLELPVTLRFTQIGEKMRLLGDEMETITKANELAYSDQEKLITLDVNYRDIDATKITLKTKNVILIADGAPGLTETEVLAALKKGAEYIQQFCGGTIGEYQIIE